VRKQDTAWFAALGAALLSVLTLLRRRVRASALLALGAAGAGVASRRWSRDDRAPFPYSLRWILDFPHPITPELLRRGVGPSEGDHVLEIGPGTGRHAVQVAQWVAPAGTLDVFDVQQEMLDAVMRRAGDVAVTNISSALGQAGERLPYPDDTASTPPTWSPSSVRSPMPTSRSASCGGCCARAGGSRSAR